MPSPKIIVVDDDRNLLELLKMRLEASGFEVSIFSREEDALEAVKKQGFDLGIVDLQLSRQDGITLMEAFRAINPEMPVIIFTAYGSIESAVEAMRKGAFGYATKPFNSPELLLQIERALESRKLTYDEWARQKIPSMICTKNKGMIFHCNRSFNILCLNCYNEYVGGLQ